MFVWVFPSISEGPGKSGENWGLARSSSLGITYKLPFERLPLGVSRIAQWVKALPTNPDNLTLFPRTRGENRLSQAAL